MAIRPIAVKYAELSAANGDRHQLNYPIQFVVGWIDRIRLIRSEGADNNLAHIKSIKPSQPGWNSVELFSCLLRIMYVSMPRIIGHNTNISALLPFLDGNKMKNVKIPCSSRRNFQKCILIDCDSIQLCDNIQIETSHRIHIKLETWVEAVYFGGMFYDSHSIHKTGIIRLGKLKLFCALPLLPMLSNLLWICAMYQLNWQNRKNSHVCGYVSGTMYTCACAWKILFVSKVLKYGCRALSIPTIYFHFFFFIRTHRISKLFVRVIKKTQTIPILPNICTENTIFTYFSGEASFTIFIIARISFQYIRWQYSYTRLDNFPSFSRVCESLCFYPFVPRHCVVECRTFFSCSTRCCCC